MLNLEGKWGALEHALATGDMPRAAFLMRTLGALIHVTGTRPKQLAEVIQSNDEICRALLCGADGIGLVFQTKERAKERANAN